MNIPPAFRNFPVNAGNCLLALVIALTASPSNAAPLNVVLIFCDDLGYADITPFGAPTGETPHLDRLAREGRKFTRFYVASPVCTASRAALLTGCYPGRVGLHGALSPGARIGLNADETTLAEIAKSRGLATAIVGKWHLGSRPEFLPTRHGFDEWLGLPYSNDMWPHHPEAKAGTYPPLPLYENERVIDEEVSPEDQTLLPARYAARAVDFIRRNAERPFFLYFAPNMPHVPLFAGEGFRGKSPRGLYGDVIREIDWSVGEILRALDEHGLAEKTLVIFTSDNGPWLSYGEHAGSAGPLREGKGTCWEGGVRVPCLMRWPGQIPASTESAEPLMTIDLLPTIAGRWGAPLPEVKIDGRDEWATISTDAPSAPRTLFFAYANNELQAAVSGRWKLQYPHTYRMIGTQPPARGGIPVRYEAGRVTAPELYDLTADPGETRNVIANHPDEVAAIEVAANAFRADLGDSLTKTPATGARPPGRSAEPSKDAAK